MKPTKFMRIPFFVQGYLVTEDNMEDIAKWCEGLVIRSGDKPFVRVPVDRATHKKQSEAYEGTWVVVSTQRGKRSFKVYSDDWLRKQFHEIPPEALDDDLEIPDVAVDGAVTDTNVRPFPAPRTEVNPASKSPVPGGRHLRSTNTQ